PAHAAGSVNICATSPDTQTSCVPFTVAPPPQPPVVTAIAPLSGSAAGGTLVTITGTGFAGGATVALGGIAATVITVNATPITALTPAHAAGTVNVVVTNPDGQSATLFNGFTYSAALVFDTFTDLDGTQLPVHTPDVHPAGAGWRCEPPGSPVPIVQGGRVGV